ncbi:hypothetical protein [Lysobacter sp. D1-1-M9]|uniref:hypothetical protein n=1 Tax=Novilysobacter longmucuonensis TaxID=3098603 RepID=UPI002FC78856
MRDYLTRRVLGYLTILALMALLSLLGIGNARAQTACGFLTQEAIREAAKATYATEGESFAACSALDGTAVTVHLSSHGGRLEATGPNCVVDRVAKEISVYYVTTGTRWSGTSCDEFHADSWAGENRLFAVGFQFAEACPEGTEPQPNGTCAAPPPTCDELAPSTSTFTPPNGSTQCANQCQIAYYYNGDGTSTAYPTGATCIDNEEEKNLCGGDSYWHSALNVCAPTEPPDCEEGQTAKEGVCTKPNTCPTGMVEDANGLCKPEKNECPAGQVKSPDGSCLPGDGQCSAGEARGADGTCKKDADGDGEPDPDDPANKSFSGGDQCDAPPSCSGDPIMCGQARIQWRIDCNTRKNRNISGGACDSAPVCTGENCDAMEYASLLQQWRTTCHLEKLAGSGEGDGEGQGSCGAGDADCNGIADDLEGGTGEGQGEPGLGTDDGGAGWAQVDQAGWLGGGSCPGLPVFTISGQTFDLSETPCEQGGLLANLFLTAALAAAAFIVGRAASGG